jgi:hypothetical protein
MSVRRRLCHVLPAHEPAGSRSILHDDLLPDCFGQLLCDEPPVKIVRTAGNEGDNDAQRTRRKNL